MADQIFKEQNSFSLGWDIVKACNEALSKNSLATEHLPERKKAYTTVRQQTAAYFKLGISKPGKLHSAILSIAVKLGTLSPDFHLVPFLTIWGLENLRPEDSDARVSEDGKRIPSLVERLAKSYAYALLFHPEEHIEPELESLFFPHLQKKGFLGVPGPKVTPLMVTRLIQKDVRGRKMTFVSLIASDGTEFMTEVHTLTTYQYMRYDDIPGTVFNTLLRTSGEKGNIRIEAAIPTAFADSDRSKFNSDDTFPTKVGYVEFIDQAHGHIHIYDNESRHLVAEKSRIQAKTGDYVLFTPIVPKSSNFKMAIIRNVMTPAEGPSAFGLRRAKVQYVDSEKGYASWELLPEPDGSTKPIIETGTTEPSFTRGYINQTLASAIGRPLPPVGTEIELIVFLKRGKDRQKHPHVIFYKYS